MGSVFGPLLFLIYMNDLSNSLVNSEHYLFLYIMLLLCID